MGGASGMNTHALTTLWTLLRRELWESPIAFKWTPLGIAGLIIVFTLLTMIIGARFDAEMVFTTDALRMFANETFEQKQLVVSGMLFSFATIFFQLMLLIILFYLAGSLYDDRKDRSILFWKSLPVSDWMTVTSKLATAALLIPAMFLAAIIITHLALLIIASGYGLVAGVNPITEFWLPASLPRLWTVMAVGLLIQALWLLPIYAWLIFCSSWAPRLPILIAIAIPAAIAITQHVWTLVSSFSLPQFNIGLIMLKRLGSSILPLSADINFDGNYSDIQFHPDLFMSYSNVFSYLFRWDMWVGIVIGLGLLGGAVWFRRRATDI
jgi:ABC-2 type transport system permease protein